MLQELENRGDRRARRRGLCNILIYTRGASEPYSDQPQPHDRACNQLALCYIPHSYRESIFFAYLISGSVFITLIRGLPGEPGPKVGGRGGGGKRKALERGERRWGVLKPELGGISGRWAYDS